MANEPFLSAEQTKRRAELDAEITALMVPQPKPNATINSLQWTQK